MGITKSLDKSRNILNIDNKFLNAVKFNKYILDFNLLDGWFEIGALRIFEVIDDIQKKNNIQGNLFEIGCYNGKSSIMLGLMAEFNKELVGVCDVFKTKTEIGSGFSAGSKNKFLQNIQKYCLDSKFLKIYQKSSQKLSLKEIGDNYRFFHIDGGHLGDETYSDLCLAEKAINKKGIIIIDDYFNKMWPGVSEGVCRFFLKHPNNLAPLLIGHNKFVFCKKTEYDWWIKELNSIRVKYYLSLGDYVTPKPEFFINKTKFFGFDVNFIFKDKEFIDGYNTKEKILRFSKRLKLKSRHYRNFIGLIKRE